MLIGVNATSPATFARCDTLWESDNVDYIELMLDNFVHLNPGAILSRLNGRPVAIHIMSSKFLHKTPNQLRELADTYRTFFEPLNPMYVSDHLGRHEVHGYDLPEMIDVDYTDSSLLDKCAAWQDALKCPIHLENYASNGEVAGDPVQFFETLQRETNVGILFDISNAIVAEHNSGSIASRWIQSAVNIGPCHISGFTRSNVDPSLYIDSHDMPIDSASWGLLDALIANGRGPTTLTTERDGPSSMAAWSVDVALATGRK